jgi:hypothetical protein
MSIKILNKIKKSVFLCTSVGKGYYKKIKSEIWLPVVIHKAKPRNNALDVFGGIETIIMPLPRHPPKKSFCLMPPSFAPHFLFRPFSTPYIKNKIWGFIEIINLGREGCYDLSCKLLLIELFYI